MSRYLNSNLVWAIPATLAIGVIWAVSAIANYYFGASLGTDKPFDALFFTTTTAKLFSSASLAADVLKCVTLFAFAASVTLGHWKPALVTGAIWLVCTAWSVASAVGFVAINHNTVTDNRGKGVEEWTQLDAQIKNLTERRKQIAPARPEGTVQAEINQLLRTPGVGNCAFVNGPVTSKVCPQVDKLKIELENAKSAAWLDGRLDDLRGEVHKSERVTSENPFAELAGGILGVVATKITTGQALWFALLLELISGPGLWAMWAAVPKPSVKPEAARAAGGETGGYHLPSAVASPAPRPRLDALTKIAGVSAADHVPDVTKMVPEQFAETAKTPTVSTLENLPQIGSNSPNLEPDGPGTPVNLPENPDGSTEETTEPTNVVPLRSDHPTKAEMRIDRRANENSVSRWLRDSTQIVSPDNKGQPAHKLIGSYLSYCRQRGETPLSKRKFSTVLRGELDLPKLRGADGKRKSAVMMFPLQLVTQNAKRRVA